MAMLMNVKNRALRNVVLLCKNHFVTTTMNMEKALENLQSNPYYEKYASKISELQKTSPEEFMARVEQREKSKNVQKTSAVSAVDTRQFSSVLNPKQAKETGLSTEKKLNDIFKLDLVEDKDGTEIKTIWEEYHKHLEVISASIPVQLYTEIKKKMMEFPVFLFPLPRAQGYEFMMSQCHGHSVHFTPLLAYQVHKENAPECLTMVHYPELSSKGIILMRGEYDKNVLTGQEAQCLANQFQLYYKGTDQAKLDLLKMFTKSPDNFKHMDLISHLENISLI